MDLAEIWSYLALEADEEIATQFLARIASRFEVAASFPGIGSPRPELSPEVRALFEGRYAVYYVVRGNEVVIVRVLHGSRDVEGIAGHGGFIL